MGQFLNRVLSVSLIDLIDTQIDIHLDLHSFYCVSCVGDILRNSF